MFHERLLYKGVGSGQYIRELGLKPIANFRESFLEV